MQLDIRDIADKAEQDTVASDEDVLNISKLIIEQNIEAYEKLAK